MTTTQSTILEVTANVGQYGMTCKSAIVDSPKHGKLYLRQGYGGESSLDGGAYRWRHGYVSDVVGSLEQMDKMHGMELPLLEWDGNHVQSFADALGL